MQYDVSISPIYAMACFRYLSLARFNTPEDVNYINASFVNRYKKAAFKSAALKLISDYTVDPNNRLDFSEGSLYEFVVTDDLHSTMKVIFSASRNKNTLNSLEKYFKVADILPFEYSLLCFHILLMTGFNDPDIQTGIPVQLYNLANPQALRFLNRFISVSRLNMFAAISSTPIDDSVYKSFYASAAIGA